MFKDLTDPSHPVNIRDTQRKHQKNPVSDPVKAVSLKRAQLENFAIFVLKGRSLHYVKLVAQDQRRARLGWICNEIERLQNLAIEEIKMEQEERKRIRENKK